MNSSLWQRGWARYAVAVAATAVSALLRWLMPDVLSRAPYLGFYPAVVVAAILGGVGPGLVATSASLLLVNFVFVQFNILDYGLQMRNVIWLVGSTGVSLLAGWMRSAHRRAEAESAAARAAEAAVHESEEQFRTLANAIPQLCWMANGDGWIFWYNQRWYEYTGTTPQQMEGWGWQSVHDPEILPMVLEHWRGSIATGEPFDMVFPLRGADGVLRPFLTRVMPLKNTGGKVVRWFGTNTDITEQKKVEEELRKSKERLDLAVEVADLGEWELNLFDHKASRSLRHDQIFGYQYLLPEWTYEMFLEHVLPEHRAEVNDKFQASLTSGTWDFETRIRRSDGEVRWIWARGRCRFDESNQPVRMYGTVTDITDHKRALDLLVRSEKVAALGRMAASLAHDINNPLAAVMNTLFLARSNPKCEECPHSVRRYLDLADEELRRISHITHHALGFYREGSTTAAVSLRVVLDEAIDTFKSKIESKHARVETYYEGAVVEVVGMCGELRQAFSNLLANSLDAIGEHGTIKLRVKSCPDRGVRITIADDGNGIEAAAISHIFEPLFTTKGALGTGLGLWVTKQLIDKHGGTIRVRSSATGQHRGTTFSVVFPSATTTHGQERSA